MRKTIVGLGLLTAAAGFALVGTGPAVAAPTVSTTAGDLTPLAQEPSYDECSAAGKSYYQEGLVTNYDCRPNADGSYELWGEWA